MIQDQIDPRPRGERGEAFQQFERIEQEVGGAIRPPVSELQPHLPVARQMEPVLRDGRPQCVTQESLQVTSTARPSTLVSWTVSPC